MLPIVGRRTRFSMAPPVREASRTRCRPTPIGTPVHASGAALGHGPLPMPRAGAARNFLARLDPAERSSPDLVLGRIGSLEVRLATGPKDVGRAQRLRYKVFYEEMSAAASGAALLSRRDRDDYDALCDHLLVLDHDVKSGPFRAGRPKVVGTYRLLRQDVAQRHHGFYSAGEYDVGSLIDAHPGLRFLELGRSCVLKPYRTKRIVELLWHGIWTYVLHHGIDVMFGCASLEGTDPQRLALPLSFLHHHARASGPWSASAWPGRSSAVDYLPKDAIDPKAALQTLPPLIKGY